MANKTARPKLLITSTCKKDGIPVSIAKLEALFNRTVKTLKNVREYNVFAQVMGDPLSLELHLCDDEEMRGFQKKYRRLDRTTDVLSFSSLEDPKQCPKGFLGSLVISIPTVERNARRYRTKASDEFAEVFIHGILHLFSFDHVKVSPAKRERMRKIQALLLEEES